jgi:hypothetical protein
LIRKQKRPICREEEEEEEEVQKEYEKKMGFEAAISPQSRSSTISGSKLGTQKSEADHRQTQRERERERERERIETQTQTQTKRERDRERFIVEPTIIVTEMSI